MCGESVRVFAQELCPSLLIYRQREPQDKACRRGSCGRVGELAPRSTVVQEICDCAIEL
jgi:hypothetical protein